jgi:YD repeat-containing protein
LRVQDSLGAGHNYVYQTAPSSYAHTAPPGAELSVECNHLWGSKASSCHNDDWCKQMFTAVYKQACDCVQYCIATKMGNEGYLSAERSCTYPAVNCAFASECRAIVDEKLGGGVDVCRQDKLAACVAHPGPDRDPAFLYHNIITVNDGEGRPVVSLSYQTDPTRADFDKVISHTQGSGIPDSTMNFEYFLASGVGSFTSNTVCPNSSTVQAPQYVTVTHDLRGVVRFDYYDNQWRILRDINQTTNETTNYNYNGPFLEGLSRPSGAKTCYTYNSFGRPLSITDYPSSSYGGSAQPLITSLRWDAGQKLVEEVKNASNGFRAGNYYLRDAWERIVAVGAQVDAAKAEWSCFSYTDGGAAAVAAPAVQPLMSSMFAASGCLVGLQVAGGSPTALAVLPTTVRKPDGSRIE